MPDNKPRQFLPSPLDKLRQTIESGVVGGGAVSKETPCEAEQGAAPNSSPPERQNAGPPERQNSRIPEFQRSTYNIQDQSMPDFPQNSRIPERQNSSPPERENARTPAFKRSKTPATPKLNADGWEQQTTYLPPDLRLWLRQYALTTNQEISEIMAIALHEYRMRQQRG